MESQSKEVTEKKYVLDPKILRTVAFTIIALATITFATVSILAIWGFADSDAAWKALTSLGVILVSIIVVVFSNEALSSK